MAMDETDSARTAFNYSVENAPNLIYGQNVLVEEIGKLSRSFNKLLIAKNPDVVKQWREEANRRIVTSISLLDRIYLVHRKEE